MKKVLQMEEMGLFRTPQSQIEIVDYINSLNGGERIVGWTIYGLLNNLVVDRLKNHDVVVAGGDR